MRRFILNSAAKRDFFVCLGIWLVLEVICFAVVAALRLETVDITPQMLFIVSLPLGVGGACLLASATQLAQSYSIEFDNPSKSKWLTLGVRFLSWAGLLGIAFPLLVLSFQIVFAVLIKLRE